MPASCSRTRSVHPTRSPRLSSFLSLCTRQHVGSLSLPPPHSSRSEWRRTSSRLAARCRVGRVPPLLVGVTALRTNRVTSVGRANGQANIEPEWMMKWIPGYNKSDRDVGARRLAAFRSEKRHRREGAPPPVWREAQGARGETRHRGARDASRCQAELS